MSGERNIIASDSTELYVKVAGNGPVCLFVHGGPGQGTLSFEEMGGNSLEDFLTMVYLDQRGSGKSQDADDYHLDRVLLDMEEVRQSLEVEEWCLIAHSFGGILAVEYARRYPQRVSRLALANITLHFLGPTHNRMQIDFVNVSSTERRSIDFGGAILEQREAYPEYYMDYVLVSAGLAPTAVGCVSKRQELLQTVM